MILNQTKNGVVLDWNDKASIRKFIDICWDKHLKGELKVENADLKRFTRCELTRRMALLFDSLTTKKN